MMNQQLSGKYKWDILIVDDTEAILEMLSEMLLNGGYTTRTATNGALALEAIQGYPPDLILLDIMMPEMNGYQVCEKLKANHHTNDIPIIFISALEAMEHKIDAFTLGGVDYITKPFQVEEVLARVRTHLEIRDLQKQLQKANRQLQQSNQELQERNADLDAFAHTVSHDLRNPLSIITGFAKILVRQGSKMSQEETLEALEIIDQTSTSMVNIIDELLVLAGVRKIEAQMQPTAMGPIVAAARARLAYEIAEHKAQIIAPSQWPSVLGYAPWIEEVWVNYISNALKYGGRAEQDIPPRIELGFRAFNGQTSQDNIIYFWVRDNGPGIPPEEQATLFTPFTQLEQVHLKGYGMGLSIVRRIVEKLKGRVGVESQPGQGSVFYFTLPVAKPTSD